MTNYIHSRNQVDANYDVETAFDQAGVASASLDLEQVVGGDIEKIVAQIETPVVAGLADGETLVFTIEDSADGVTFEPLDPAISSTITGAGGVGSAAKDIRFRFPPITRQFVRVSQAPETTTGAIDTASFNFRLLF